MKNIYIISVMALSLMDFVRAEEAGVNLFILSGQSNMARLALKDEFIPAVEKEFGKKAVLVVKDAMPGQHIKRWYKLWTPANGQTPAGNGDLYDRLMTKVNAKNMNRQDARNAKETPYGASEISFKSSQTRSSFYLTWRSWRLGGENLFTLPNGVTLGWAAPLASPFLSLQSPFLSWQIFSPGGNLE